MSKIRLHFVGGDHFEKQTVCCVSSFPFAPLAGDAETTERRRSGSMVAAVEAVKEVVERRKAAAGRRPESPESQKSETRETSYGDKPYKP